MGLFRKKTEEYSVTEVMKAATASLIASNLDIISMLNRLADSSEPVNAEELETVITNFCRVNFEMGITTLAVYRKTGEDDMPTTKEKMDRFQRKTTELIREAGKELTKTPEYEALFSFIHLMDVGPCPDCGEIHTNISKMDKDKLLKLSQRLFIGTKEAPHDTEKGPKIVLN